MHRRRERGACRPAAEFCLSRLLHWNKLPDASVERCIKLGAKAKRQPYVAMENCLAPDIAATAAPTPEKK